MEWVDWYLIGDIQFRCQIARLDSLAELSWSVLFSCKSHLIEQEFRKRSLALSFET